MPLKKFYAPTLSGALRAVKEAFGGQAVIVSSRELMPGEWRPFSPSASGFEVVASDDPLLSPRTNGANGNGNGNGRPDRNGNGHANGNGNGHANGNGNGHANGNGRALSAEAVRLLAASAVKKNGNGHSGHSLNGMDRSSRHAPGRLLLPVEERPAPASFVDLASPPRSPVQRPNGQTAVEAVGEEASCLGFASEQDLGRELRAITGMLRRLAMAEEKTPRRPGGSTQTAQMLEHLLAQGVERQFAESLIGGIVEEAPAGALEKPEWVEEAVCKGLAQYVPVAPVLERARNLKTAIALAGPSGAGKSTCAAKIAALLRLKLDIPVQIGALCQPGGVVSESLRLTAKLLGIPVERIDGIKGVAPFCQQRAGRCKVVLDLSLPDTWVGGLSDRSASVLALRNIETHLVLSSGSKTEDLLAAVANVSLAARCKGLILTKFDETMTFGSAFDTLRKNHIPAAFFSTGQRIPEDLAPADAGDLARRLTERWPGGVRNAGAADSAASRRGTHEER